MSDISTRLAKFLKTSTALNKEQPLMEGAKLGFNSREVKEVTTIFKDVLQAQLYDGRVLSKSFINNFTRTMVRALGADLHLDLYVDLMNNTTRKAVEAAIKVFEKEIGQTIKY